MQGTESNTSEPSNLSLPQDGYRVKATTLPSLEYDREPEEIEGILYTVKSPFDEPPNCYVDGIGVDPASVRVMEDQDDSGDADASE